LGVTVQIVTMPHRLIPPDGFGMDGSFCLGYDYGLSTGGVTALFVLCCAASITHIAKFSWEHVLVSGVLPIRRTSICYLIREEISAASGSERSPT
jgi:hypothetical protein